MLWKSEFLEKVAEEVRKDMEVDREDNFKKLKQSVERLKKTRRKK